MVAVKQKNPKQSVKAVMYKGYGISKTSGGLYKITLNGKLIDTTKTLQTAKIFIDREYYTENKTKQNPTVTDFKRYSKDKLHKLAVMFQGKANGESRRTLESDFTPNNKYRLGHLVQIKVKEANETTTIDFDGESYLAADAKNNLYIVGKDARLTGVHRPKKHCLAYIGKLIQVDYITAKSHIENGKTVRFYHKLGEATREYPNVFMDHDGFLLIQGGNYDVWDVGIVN